MPKNAKSEKQDAGAYDHKEVIQRIEAQIKGYKNPDEVAVRAMGESFMQSCVEILEKTHDMFVKNNDVMPGNVTTHCLFRPTLDAPPLR